MEQIAKFLFAATVLTIFAYVVIFTSTGLAGNGGEYWGYNGNLDAAEAARLSFDAKDYRYLEIDLTDSNGIRTQVAPMYLRCRNHPLGIKLVTRKSGSELIHGYDSIKFATNFAEQFNNGMNELLTRELSVCCGDCKQR